jgi:X-X-X-Leu-X-X-Gly heptad repeat protein
MANTIKPKRSNTASKVPNTSELVSGELGVNMADKKVYINNGTSIVQVGAGVLSALGDVTISSPTNGQSLSYNGTAWVNATGAGTGDVVGGTSSTDNAITRYDGTTGKIIQNSVVVVDDSGNVTGVNSITDPDYITFNTAYATSLTAGQLGWDNTFNSLAYGMSGGNIIQHIGEDTYIYIKATAAITKGQVIMFTGSVGASGVLTGAPATGVTNGQYIVGVAAENIALNGFGYIQTFGELRNVNTSAFADGDILYYNSAVTGGFTTTFPTSGLIVTVAAVVNGGSVGGGVIQIRVTVTQRITASTGITVTQTNASTSITNSGVLGVTATSPVASSGGTAPVISLSAGYGDTLNPYASKTANFVLAAPNGTTGVPTFRAVVAADIPTLNQNTTGSSGSCTGNAATVTTNANLTGDVTSVGNSTTLSASGVTAGSYTYASITVDAKGRLTAASSGTAPQAFPSGTAMLFIQTAAPTGWTKSVTHDNKALRIVSGTASSGGSVAFTTAFASQAVTGSVAATAAATATNQATTAGGSISVTVGAGTLATGIGTLAATAGTLATGIGTLAGGATTLATTQIPSHTHPYSTMQNQALAGRVSLNDRYPIQPATTGATGGGGSHTHSISGSPSLSGTPGLTGSPSLSGSPSVTASSFTGASHNHTQDAHSHTSGAFTGNAINLAVQYVDAIIATKD